jgi:hypothetical protein
MRTLLALAALALFLLPADVSADPIVVTGGSTRTNEAGGFGGPFNLTGMNFTLNGGTGLGPAAAGGTAAAGQPISFGMSFSGTDYIAGSAQFNGVTYPVMYYAGTFSIGGTVVVPFDAPTSGLFTVTAPFTFNATLNGCATNPLSLGPCQGGLIFDNTFVGQGIATVYLSGFIANGTQMFSVSRTTYQFTEPVPEPATLVLLSTGLAGVVGAARRRRKAKNR